LPFGRCMIWNLSKLVLHWASL